MVQSGHEMIGERLLLAFHGTRSLPPEFMQALRAYRPAGVTLFRSLNIENAAQVRELTTQMQDAAQREGLAPLLIATDQEGGQLMAVVEGATPLPGNMALGAAGDAGLARRAGEVLGGELRALGVNVNYAPCCDVNVNPKNPVIGIRSFGEDPQQVAGLSAAIIEGMQSCGVAATAKHFPGHGDTAGDSHHGLPSVPHDLRRLQRVELPPFRAAVGAGVKLVMTAHMALPALDGPDAPPATLSRTVLQGLLRGQLGFDGVIITDAMDMRAITQGEGLGRDAVRAAAAGADLLLVTSDPSDQERIYRSLKTALDEGVLGAREFEQSAGRVRQLRAWLAAQKDEPGMDKVGSAAHREVADEIARRSVTLVRNDAGLLPLRLAPEARVAVVIPRPADLTPADTSSYVAPTLATAVREHHPGIDEFLVPQAPTEAEIRALLEGVRAHDLVILGTLNAFTQPGQQALVSEALKTGIPCVVVAMRLPYDLMVFPQAAGYACTYSILEPSIRALADSLFGVREFKGRLPVSIPGLYAAGSGLSM